MGYVIRAAALFFLVCGFSLPAAAGVIEGVVTFKGQPPPKKKVRMEGDAICYASHAGPVYGDTLALGDGNTLGNVFVVVKNPPAGTYPVPSTPAVIDQKGCTYTPHVQAVRAGQPVRVLNPDGTLHNVHALCKVNREINLSMPKSRQEAVITFAKAEDMFPVKCDVHPWMGAWVGVVDHPFYAVTAEDGKFHIDGLPDGTYTVQAWQEKLGTQDATVTVGGDGTARQDFSFAPPGA